MSSTLDTVIWSCDTDQRMPCFDAFAVSWLWNGSRISNCRGVSCRRMHWLTSMGAMLCDVVVRTSSCARRRPRVICCWRRWKWGNKWTGSMGMGLRMAALIRRSSALNDALLGFRFGYLPDFRKNVIERWLEINLLVSFGGKIEALCNKFNTL